MASSKLIHFMIFFKIAYVADEFHNSQVQHKSLTMINVVDELERSSKMYQMNFKLQVLGSSTNWHWPSPLAKEGYLTSKSNWAKSNQQSTQKSFRVFIIIMYINGQRPHKQTSIIAEALHLKKSEIEAHWVKKGGLFGLPSVFLIKEATTFAQAGSVDAFGTIFVLLIYGLTLFPNIDGFVDVNDIRIFLIGNPVPTFLGDMYISLHLRNSKGGGTIVCCIPLMYKWFFLHLPQTHAFMENKHCLRWSQRIMSLTNDDIVWYDPSLSSLEIIDSCGEFSNVPLIGTQGGINYNPALARRQLGFPLRDKPNNMLLEGRSELGPCNCVTLEAYTLWTKKRALELKMPYPCERPMYMVVVEPLTLPNQDVEELEDALIKMKQDKDMWEESFHALSKKHEELQLESKDKDTLIELLEDRVTKRQREPEVSSSSMPQLSVSWKKIAYQLVLEKTQMKASFETEICRIQRKYAPSARYSDIVVRDP
ncbi:hypothetical protein KIW84_021222 [Lathyrus oleraceus]|uniref:DUF7745 domain-containing protein n=1 Tax=Pisum sativum TaxID=3888 RepID=A0A9D5B541_PEA|nr:hypothetical protein KIW84_021222 [Pisum sativum]